MRIGIDLDGTIFQTYERMAEVFYLETGKNMDLSTIGSAETMIPSELKWLKKYFEKPEAHNVAPYPDAMRILKELEKRHELYFITARRKEVEEDTRRIMKSYGFDKRIFIVSRENKVETYKLLKLNLILEDELCFVEPFYTSKTKIILF
ncbi:MAG: hypothetical protein NT145_03585, partial [Elusimicrobia bacterium]|nr:hypothetical protein [Elusimicrobiota bacterium]